MKQIGNLAVVCARRQDVLLQVGSEKVCVHVGAGPERNTLHAAWDDDDAMRHSAMPCWRNWQKGSVRERKKPCLYCRYLMIGNAAMR